MKTNFFSAISFSFFAFFILAFYAGAKYYMQGKESDGLSLVLILCAAGLCGLALFLIYIFRQYNFTRNSLYKAAYIDPITQGPTWTKARQEIRELLARNPQEKFAFVIFDINKFKVLNERLGYLKANDILRHIGTVLGESLGKEEMFCRVQADIFQLLLKYQTPEQLKNRLEILNEQIVNSVPLGQNPFQLILSFGVYFVPEHVSSINDLLVKAAIARDRIKGKYDDIVGFYNEKLQSQFLLEQEIENNMEQALHQQAFQLHLSAIRNMDGTLYAAEAFFRWQLPSCGEIPEKLFRKVFTKNGFIYQMDLYAAEKVCQFQRERIDLKKDLFPVFLNLSSDTLRNPQFAAGLARLMKRYQLDSRLLVLQASPQNEISQTDTIAAMANRLHEEGFVLSLDQAGKGYSSLELLKILPLEVIKIEDEAVFDLQENERTRRLAESLIYMAKQLKMKIIFGGVKTEKQKNILKNLGADFIAGPLMGEGVVPEKTDLLFQKL